MRIQEDVTPVTRHWGHFARHYVEMLIAMAVGMVVVGAAVRIALAGAGLSMTDRVELVTLEMAFDMSVGMLVWMRVRRHGWAASLEMCGVMFAPLVVLFPLLWAGVVTAGSVMVLEHALMLPLMFLAMLRRRDEYAH